MMISSNSTARVGQRRSAFGGHASNFAVPRATRPNPFMAARHDVSPLKIGRLQVPRLPINATAADADASPAADEQQTQQRTDSGERASTSNYNASFFAPKRTKPANSGINSEASVSPFSELDLAELWEGLGRTRVRQHVNPLRAEYQTAAAPLDWVSLYDDPTLPLVVDLGCGYGRFLLLLQKRNPERKVNYLGIEIRRSLVERGNEWAGRLGVAGRLRFEFANATLSLGSMLSSYPGVVEEAYIQYPDPHFKRRHRKRRIFQPSLVSTLTRLIRPGGRLLLQSDMEFVAVAMRNIFEKYAGHAFSPEHEGQDVFFSQPATGDVPSSSSSSSAAAGGSADCAASAGASEALILPAAGVQSSPATGADASDPESSAETETDSDLAAPDPSEPGDEVDDYENLNSQWAQQGWLAVNPLGTPTEREWYVLQKGLPCYRVMLRRR